MTGLLHQLVYRLLGLPEAGRIVGAEGWTWYAVSPPSRILFAFVLMAGLIAATLSFVPRTGTPWRIRVLTGLLRMAGFGLLLLFLVRLELHVDVERELPPNVAVVTDRSGSMARPDVEGRSRYEAAREFAGLLRGRLASGADIAAYDLDWTLRPTAATEDTTAAGMARMGEGLRALSRAERDLQAVVLLTDGSSAEDGDIASAGPLFAARGTPIYPVVFGRSDAPPLPSVRFTGGGDYIRLGDELRLEAVLAAGAFEGEVVRASLFEDDNNEPVLPPREGIRLGARDQMLAFTLRPERPGRRTYRIVVEGLRGAVSTDLMTAEHIVDVVDQRIRVLYIDIPRDERKLVGHWLSRDPVVDFAGLLKLPRGGWFGQGELRHTVIEGGHGLPENEADLYEYDIIILGDIPRGYFGEQDPDETRMRWLADFVSRRGGGLITLGGYTVYNAGQYEGSALAAILPFRLARQAEAQEEGYFRVMPTGLGLAHPIMTLERDREANRAAWFELPRVDGVNRVAGVRPGATLLAVVEREAGPLPVIAVHGVGNGRVLSLAMDTTWRWQMLRPRGSERTGVPEGPDYFRQFWGNAVRYLAPDPRLTPDRPGIVRQSSDAAVGQTLELVTRLVDRFYRPIRQADLTVRVTAPSGRGWRLYPADSRGEPGMYPYRVTLDEPGEWMVTATHREADVRAAIAAAERDLEAAAASGEAARVAVAEAALSAARAAVSVERIRVGGGHAAALRESRARPDLMDALAHATFGRRFDAGDVDALLSQLRVKTYRVRQRHAVAIWNLPAMLILFMAIVCLDCLIRKRRGMP